ncbi:MAPEG family protein [Leptothoe sp. PORK10 BA2]|uniref:MAPEG family protein n=1 Tax=Leptothoe sp. PORK10 BA2 TaxID=3110254 RepID=UPI002B212543|nr:MAPEG family protein [Leptothoe sp. PORK10 BA2]MEA5464738.1 MAPEG family protein [Leptothoe sp. PORK10 BA2]
MTIELWTLLGSVTLLLTLNMSQAMYTSLTEGVGYALSNRDEPPNATHLSGRIQRAKTNLVENLLIFTSLILMAQALGISTGLTRLGAVLFLVSRILHAIVYVVGITHLRSLIWVVSLMGMAMIAVGIIQH